MKKKKTLKADAKQNGLPIEKGVLATIKEGTEVLYLTRFTVDKCKVVSVSKKEDVAVLSNQLKISKKITSAGFLTQIGGNPLNTTLRVWSPEVEEEYEYEVAKRSITTIMENLKRVANTSLTRQEVVLLVNKLKRLSNKFGDNV
jgi:transcriptional regulator NrdR family protein